MNRLGCDIGGVITSNKDDHGDTSFFSGNFLQTPQIEGAFDALDVLCNTFLAANTFLISKCGERVEAKTREYLAHHDFYAYTGIAEEHVYYCRKREDKAEIARGLGLTHFIDDRLEVLGYMVGVVANLYLFKPSVKEVGKQPIERLADVHLVESWDELLTKILGRKYNQDGSA